MGQTQVGLRLTRPRPDLSMLKPELGPDPSYVGPGRAEPDTIKKM